MKDFLFYMLFSGFEFLAGFTLLTSFFNIDIRYYIKEILVGTIIITIISYILTITDYYQIIPIPLIVAVLFTFIISKFFKKKLKYAIITSIGTSLFYGLLQTSLVYICIYMKYINFNQINDAFSHKTYAIQVLCASLTIIISIYLRIFNGGFGFSLRKEKSNHFIVVSILLILVCGLCSATFNFNNNATYFILSIVVLGISYTLFHLLSHKRELIEFS